MIKQSKNIETGEGPAHIDACGVDYRELNQQLLSLVSKGAKWIHVYNVHGQRYIGTNLRGAVRLDIYGTPGNDLASFMQGPTIHVHGNAQDGCGNTLNGGELVIHGHAGDITGYAMRDGKIFVRGNVGYRAAIHMKEYLHKKPVLVIGGTAQPFLGEYMAGGIVVVLGLSSWAERRRHVMSFIGTGMHGGAIYFRGTVDPWQLGKEVAVAPVEDVESEGIASLVREFCAHFGYDAEEILQTPFCKIYPRYLRPYGRLYAY